MIWTLVFIVITPGEVKSETIDTYDNLRDCFFARENLTVELGSYDGYFPVNTQGLCIKTNLQ